MTMQLQLLYLVQIVAAVDTAVAPVVVEPLGHQVAATAVAAVVVEPLVLLQHQVAAAAVLLLLLCCLCNQPL